MCLLNLLTIRTAIWQFSGIMDIGRSFKSSSKYKLQEFILARVISHFLTDAHWAFPKVSVSQVPQNLVLYSVCDVLQ